MEAHHNKPHSTDENGLAIASLILGVISFTGFGPITGIPAIITGAMGMKNPHNKGMAVAGLVLGIVSTAFAVLFLMFLVLIFVVAGTAAQSHPELYDAIESGTTESSYQQRI